MALNVLAAYPGRSAGLYDWPYPAAGEQEADRDAEPALVATNFERSIMRTSWCLEGSGSMDFGLLGLSQDGETARLLRSVLREVATGSERPGQDRLGVRTTHCGSASWHYWAILDRAYRLATVLGLANEPLLAHSELSARAAWWCYADENVRQGTWIYRLSVSYSMPTGGIGQGTDGRPEDLELWALIPAIDNMGEQVAEAALQRYIRGWQRVQRLTVDKISWGLIELWELR